MASTRLTKTDFGTQTSQRKFTISVWCKICDAPNDESILFHAYSSGTETMSFSLENARNLKWTSASGGNTYNVKTNAKYRDPNGWYHFLVKVDTTQATAADRVEIYVNGEEITSLATSTYPAQNADIPVPNGTQDVSIGSWYAGSGSQFWNGSMSHFHFVDGTAYSASTFGETDSTTGEWKINTNPSVTYGNNGFFLFKDDNSADDQSGNDNDFTTSGTLTQTEDCPSNVFCTLNPLGLNADVTFANGNNNATYGTSGTRSIVTGTLGASSGKYYWECEIQGSVSANNAVLGVSMSGWETGYAVAGESNQSWGFRGYDGAVYNNNSSVGGTFATFTNGDIIGVAINLDDEQSGLNKLYFSKNGTWLNGADPSNPSSTTGVIGITKPENGDSGFYFPVISDAGSSATPKFKMNFGNGYFGSTAISSEGTNASGIGKFEYDVPTGFTALSTKGLNE